MDFEKIKSILEVIKNTQINELNYEKGNKKIYIKKGKINGQQLKLKSSLEENKTNQQTKSSHNIIKSKYVGTVHLIFPDTQKEIIKLNDFIKKGDKLCIIEAMKLYKEVFSEFDGKIIKILIKNGAPVYYGQELFWVE